MFLLFEANRQQRHRTFAFQIQRLRNFRMQLRAVEYFLLIYRSGRLRFPRRQRTEFLEFHNSGRDIDLSTVQNFEERHPEGWHHAIMHKPLKFILHKICRELRS